MGAGEVTSTLDKPAIEVCHQLAEIGTEAKECLRDGITSRQFLDCLLEKNLLFDAIRFLAHALPKREAIWWACVCARLVSERGGSGPAETALAVAEQWVKDPSEDNRRASVAAAEATELSTAAGCAAMAVFFSGGSLAPPEAPVVPPPDHVTARCVAGSISLAAVAREPQNAPDRHREFVTAGISVAQGQNRW